MKALVPVCKSVQEFPPGHYLWSKDGQLTQYYQRDWMEYGAVEHNTSSVEELREAMEAAVKRQLMCDVPYGVLLSGGLDSSVISAITKKFAARRVEDNDNSEAWWPQLHSFAVGLQGSPDLAAAQKVADHLGTIHHEIHFTVQEGLDALRDVIYVITSYSIHYTKLYDASASRHSAISAMPWASAAAIQACTKGLAGWPWAGATLV